jgi:phage terminase Nu1 subunit (DNA packaging protein)
MTRKRKSQLQQPIVLQPRLGSAAGLAKLLDVSTHEVETLIAAGIFVKLDSDDRYCTLDVDSSIRRYTEHLRRQLGEAQARADIGDAVAADNALRLKNSLLTRAGTDSWTVERVERTWILLIATISKAMLAVPQTVYDQCTDMTKHERKLIEVEIRKALDSIARGTVKPNGRDHEQQSEGQDAGAV